MGALRGKCPSLVYKNNALGVKLLEQEYLEILFSISPNRGLEIKNRKYRVEADCPIIVNGGSTGFVAAQVIVRKVTIKVQNISCVRGRNFIDRVREV